MTATAKQPFSGEELRGVVGYDPVGIYRRREKAEKVSAYVPPETRKRIERLAKLWTIITRAEDAKAAEWSESEAARRLIEASIDEAFRELGVDPEPKPDEDWAKVEAAVVKRVRLAAK